MTGHLTGLSSTIAFTIKLGPRPTWSGVGVWLSVNCQGLEQGEVSEVTKEQSDAFSSYCLAAQLQRPMERNRRLVPLGWICRFTHRVCHRRSQECS